MIDVSKLTKQYGSILAVDQVTFSIQPGEVVGLLGPNGAGKTTMLKMLTGYLPPTEGTAQVAQIDILGDTMELRRRVGYLPETNPLYDELAVVESLQWTARLRSLEPAAAQKAIRHVIDVCGLDGVVGQDIGQLSKGYRQRVGLAQAILHDPEILILDEPTSGLDPNQQSEVRQLIQTLRQSKTVLLSTHILSEAQSTCDRVLIIHKGKIVADGSPELLGQRMRGGQRLLVELKAPAEAARSVLAGLPGVERVTVQKENGPNVMLSLESGESDLREAIFNVAVQNHWIILQLVQEGFSLEDVFRQLTSEEPASASVPAGGAV
ncbi:MAG: ATP-binding cassette domain-containing protein [Elusimicrobiota bacterium]|jgi:ABC-2 type transport system ATP-binding protein